MPLHSNLAHGHPFFLCSICNEFLELETAKTDDGGQPVHEECYVKMVILKRSIRPPPLSQAIVTFLESSEAHTIATWSFNSSLLFHLGPTVDCGRMTGNPEVDRKTADRLSFVHSGRSLFFVAPLMCCLDIVRMIVPPRSPHSFRAFVVRNDVVVVGEFFVADGARASLFSDLAVEQLPHLPRRSKFPISTRVVRISNPLNSKPNQFGLGKEVAATASQGSVDGAQFIATKSHGYCL